MTQGNQDEILAKLQVFLTSNDQLSFKNFYQKEHLADLAQCMSKFSATDIKKLLLMMPSEDEAELFSYLKIDLQIAVVAYFNRKQLAVLFTHMSGDERADLFNLLSALAQAQVMPALAQAEREDIRKLASYPEGTVGSVMTSEYATLSPDLTAQEAVEQLRLVAPDKETIYQSYVVDNDHRLIGTLSLRELITALPDVKIAEIMRRDVLFVRVDEHRENAASYIAKYDVMAIPVVDAGEKLVGIVTYDDAMDVAEEAATEDFHKAGGSLGLAGISLKDAKVLFLFRKRILWLILLVFGNLFSGAGIAYFEETISAYVALVFFLPLLIDSGGNAGSQSATLMVRALATGDVYMRDWGKMFGREFLVAILLGLAMAFAVSFLGVLRGGFPIALVVSSTMILVVITGSVIGMSLPFVLNKLNLDPATASAPLITSISDAVGVIIYFSVATSVLPMPV